MFISPVYRCPLHVACQAPRGWERWQITQGGDLWSRPAGMAQPFPGFCPPDSHLSKGGQDIMQLFSQNHKLWDRELCLSHHYFRLSRLCKVPSLGEILISLLFQYIFPSLHSQNFCLSLFPVLSWRLFWDLFYSFLSLCTHVSVFDLMNHNSLETNMRWNWIVPKDDGPGCLLWSLGIVLRALMWAMRAFWGWMNKIIMMMMMRVRAC